MNTTQRRPSGTVRLAARPTALVAALLLLAGCPDARGPSATSSADDQGPVEAGRNALRAEQFDAAVADADDYLRGQPHGADAAEALYIKGFAYQNKSFLDGPGGRRADLHEARAAYEAALGERPVSLLQGYVRTGLSSVALYQDDFATALDQAARATPLLERPETKAGLLYNSGLAQQRLGRFSEADQTFGRVAAENPGTPLAAAARAHQGQRQFYVQLAAYASVADADRAMQSLRTGGAIVSRGTDAQGHSVVDLGPFSTYAAARQQRDALAGSFPAALIVP